MTNIDTKKLTDLLTGAPEEETILFLKKELADTVLPIISNGVYESIEVAVRGKIENGLDFPPDRILDPAAVDFVDNVKILTGGDGFSRVVVLDDDPETIKQALGVGAVFSDIYLLMPLSEKVSADLTATINFKSLRIHGYSIL